MGRVGPKPKGSGIKLIKGVIRFKPDLKREFASILNLSETSQASKITQVVDELGQVLAKYPNLIETLDYGARPAHRKADLHLLRDQLKNTIKALKNMSDSTFEDLLQGYTLNTPIDFDDEAWTWDFERKERSNDIKRNIKCSIDNLQLLIKYMEAVEQKYYNQESRHGIPKKARKELCTQLGSLFKEFYQEIPEDNPKDAETDFLHLAFRSFNQLNLTSDPLPTSQRAILTLLKQTYPPEPIRVHSNVL